MPFVNGKKMVLVEACSIEKCWNPIKNKGWCAKHVGRWERMGDPLKVKNIFNNNDKRFVSKVRKTDTCWIWNGAKNKAGYGLFWNGKRMEMAHRWIYQRNNKIDIGELTLDHLCYNRLCVNPSHMEPVTLVENIRRANRRRHEMASAV